MRAVASLAFVAAASAACATQSPVAPTADTSAPAQSIPTTGILTVRVLARTSEQPIAGASVLTPTGRATTDAAGVCTLSVSTGETVDVSVSADGYQPMGASGVLNANERWTFYLPLAN
jgi:hypothetical protein